MNVAPSINVRVMNRMGSDQSTKLCLCFDARPVLTPASLRGYSRTARSLIAAAATTDTMNARP
eukprot:4587011-Prymnesium_polylepis.1